MPSKYFLRVRVRYEVGKKYSEMYVPSQGELGGGISWCGSPLVTSGMGMVCLLVPALLLFGFLNTSRGAKIAGGGD